MAVAGTDGRAFDLNIEKILEHWKVAHAVREVIANALDEQALTSTQEPEVFKDDQGPWHIRDWGRGLRYEHLTQNENRDKLSHPDQVVGKFGVGLKDALATLDRHRIRVLIKSPHGDITIRRHHKHGFNDISTLHALIVEPSDSAFCGTDVVLDGVRDQDIEKAKDFFLRYSGEESLEHTPYGDVLQRGKKTARIYVNGLHVASEENFLFSYNITSTTKPLRQALNRERTNVGRSAYSQRVKDILLACQQTDVADALARDLEALPTGRNHDEVTWLDVGLHACRILNASERVLFVNSWQLIEARSFIERAKGDGYRIVVVPDSISSKLHNELDIAGDPILDLAQYQHKWNLSFEYVFVTEQELTPKEREVWRKTKMILRNAGGKPRCVREVRISQSLRPESHSYREAVGVWDPENGWIVIKRSQLCGLVPYAATLLHETVHARSDADDVSVEFEDELTSLLGVVSASCLAEAEKSRARSR